MRKSDPADLPLPAAQSWDETRLVRVRARPRRIRPGWFSRLTLAAGLLLLVYVAAVRLEATWAQRWAARRLSTADQHEAAAAPSAPAGMPGGGAAVAAPLPGEPVGRLSIPRLALDVVALEGVDDDTLRRGAGHFPGTALPGQVGNASFAGHRDSFFRALRDVRSGDEVRVEAPDGDYLYRVTETRVVGPSEVGVIDPLGGSLLTLVTCHPFDWIGPAPRRFVVRGTLVEPRIAG
jgi:sortase A